MKGIILNLVEDVVRSEHGEDYWDDVVDETGLAASYTSLGTYPDHEVVRHVGHVGMATLAARYPAFFEPHDGLHPFLLSINTIVHPEVRRLYPGAVIPEFEHSQPAPGVIELGYTSERGRCDLAEGLVLGAAQHYGERVVVSQPMCVHRGDDRCVIRVEPS
jgi:hypothetical protein